MIESATRVVGVADALGHNFARRNASLKCLKYPLPTLFCPQALGSYHLRWRIFCPMREYKIRNDLERAVIDGFALPLGIQPINLPSPTQGYTLEFHEGEEGEPDTFSFHIVSSHDRMVGLVREALGLLPDQVTPIMEVGSRDAYRSVDVFMGREPISFESFLEIWEGFEPVIMEDASIGVGANSEEPFVEVFLDSWKGLLIHVAVDNKETVERLQDNDLSV